MLKFIENHPYWTMLIMSVSTIIGFVLSEIHHIQQIEKEYQESQQIKITGGQLNEYKFDKRV